MDKKDLIRKSAIKVIARDGFHNAKVKAIAEGAGVAAGTVYLYFRSKEDILDYIFSVEHKKRADFFNSLNQKHEAIGTVIDSFLEFHLRCFRDEPDTARVLQREAITALSLKEQKTGCYLREVLKAFSAIIARGQASGTVRDDIEADFLSASIVYFLISSSYSVPPKADNKEYANIKRQLKAFILYGIAR